MIDISKSQPNISKPGAQVSSGNNNAMAEKNQPRQGRNRNGRALKRGGGRRKEGRERLDMNQKSKMPI
jgi:hypothetical protein